MKPRMAQVGILPEFDSQAPADYSKTVMSPLTRDVWVFIRDQGVRGATSGEVAKALDKTQKSIAGRCTEMVNVGLLRRTEAVRDGVVYIVVEGMVSW